jgi:hypothetical protein
LGGVPTNLNNLRADFGLAGLDRKHRFVVSGIYELPWFKNDSSLWKRKRAWQLDGLVHLDDVQRSSRKRVFLPNNVDLSATGTFLTYLPGTGPGAVGREIRSVISLEQPDHDITTTTSAACRTQPRVRSTRRCCVTSMIRRSFGVGLLPADTQIGGDSIISQDIRVTKTINFSEKYRLQLTGRYSTSLTSRIL